MAGQMTTNAIIMNEGALARVQAFLDNMQIILEQKPSGT